MQRVCNILGNLDLDLFIANTSLNEEEKTNFLQGKKIFLDKVVHTKKKHTQWRENNREHISEYNRDYYMNNRQQILAQKKHHRENLTEKEKEEKRKKRKNYELSLSEEEKARRRENHRLRCAKYRARDKAKKESKGG